MVLYISNLIALPLVSHKQEVAGHVQSNYVTRYVAPSTVDQLMQTPDHCLQKDQVGLGHYLGSKKGFNGFNKRITFRAKYQFTSFNKCTGFRAQFQGLGSRKIEHECENDLTS